ncbi:MAG: Transcriptional regulator, Crp/Fnr family [uncultured Sulfurovum sp.]|uniref:Transcriptional regulator, Crp/Fnr family n=1 Tax=uncultured Sulfurovum sp. TaxID=269237 RepID=A0A6S6SXM7_9BACT|nr:MAG: Transcriptional regulator, Crp/Fnr family [uncultured Sulfurovum sp.]
MITDKLRKLELLKMLDDSEIELLANMATLKKLSYDNILFYEGEEPQYFYLLLDGYIKVYKTDLKGNEIVIHYFRRSTFIAEMSSLENFRFPATAIAKRDDVEVLLIDKEKFFNLLQTNAHFSFHMIKSMTVKIKQLEQVINRNMVYDALAKVCSFLDEYPNDFQYGKNKEIANFLNMAPETLSRILSQLKKLEIIDKNNLLLDKEKLKTLLEV